MSLMREKDVRLPPKMAAQKFWAIYKTKTPISNWFMGDTVSKKDAN